jgi:hypothetical protein
MEDIELWHLRGDLKKVRCLRREIHNERQHEGRTLVGYELRVELEGSMYITELYSDLRILEARSAELREMLEARGWKGVERGDS